MNKMFVRTLAFVAMTFLTGIQAQAQHKGINFQAVLKTPSGTLPNVVGLTATVQILTSNNCVLREEEHPGVNITNGYINLVIGGPTSVAAGGHNPSPLLNYQEIFNNSVARTGLTCINPDDSVAASGQTYTPLASDARKMRLRLQVPGEGLVVADFNLRSVPFAVSAETLNGKSENDFIKTSTNVTQNALETFFSSSSLSQILGGTYNAPTATNAVNVTGTIAISHGGTGATTLSGAKAALGIGTVGSVNLPSPLDATKVLLGDGTWGNAGGGPSYTAGAGLSLTAGEFKVPNTGISDAMLATGISGSKISGAISGNAANVTGTVAIANGGTNSTTALTNNKAMISSSGSIVESSVTAAELGYLSGVTSSVQTQLGARAPASGWTNYSALAVNGSGSIAAVPGSLTGSLLSWTAAGPVWTTASFPASTTANQLIYSSANNVVGGLATVNSAVLVTNGSGVPGWSVLSNDNFTQYALLAGRAGGQSLTGGTVASENLTLDSTAHATKGYVLLNPSGGNVGVGTPSPVAKLDVAGDVKVGNSAVACSGTNEGAVRYNSTSKVMEYCNATAWTTMSGAADTGVDWY